MESAESTPGLGARTTSDRTYWSALWRAWVAAMTTNEQARRNRFEGRVVVSSTAGGTLS
jgi:hypothetical protein